MFILANFLRASAHLIDNLLWLLTWVILIQAVLSWFKVDPWHPFLRALDKITSPILWPLRRMLPRTGLDLSPILAFFIIYFLRDFLVATLIDLSLWLKSGG